MSELFNEAEADAIVAANIARYKLSLKEGQAMQFINTPNGVQRVVTTQEVKREELTEAVEKAKKQLEKAEADLKNYDQFVGHSTPEPAKTETPEGTVIAPVAPQPQQPQAPQQPAPVVVTPPVQAGTSQGVNTGPKPVVIS